MVLLTALSGVLVFSLARSMGGRFCGYVALGLFGLNPYVADTLCLAMAEAPLVAAILAVIWIGARTVERIRLAAGRGATRRGPRLAAILGCVALGAAAGLAGASKLNGVAAIAGAALLVLMVPLVDDGRTDVGRARLALVGALTTLATGLFTFFALNPFFFHNPVRRISELIPALLNSLERRRAEGLGDIIAPHEHLGLLVERVFQTFSAVSFRHAALLNGILCAVGLLAILGGARTWLRGRGDGPAAATCTAFSVVALVSVVPTLTTPLDWERYYILPVLFSTLCIAQAVGVLGARGLALARSRAGPGAPDRESEASPVRGG